MLRSRVQNLQLYQLQMQSGSEQSCNENRLLASLEETSQAVFKKINTVCLRLSPKNHNFSSTRKPWHVVPNNPAGLRVSCNWRNHEKNIKIRHQTSHQKNQINLKQQLEQIRSPDPVLNIGKPTYFVQNVGTQQVEVRWNFDSPRFRFQLTPMKISGVASNYNTMN